jgi:DNA polymerase V
MLRDGVDYKRAGIALMDLARPQDLQGDLFTPVVIGNTAMMETLDLISRRFGSGSVGLAASGWERKPAWGMGQQSLSPCYTTRLSDLPRVTC